MKLKVREEVVRRTGALRRRGRVLDILVGGWVVDGDVLDLEMMDFMFIGVERWTVEWYRVLFWDWELSRGREVEEND